MLQTAQTAKPKCNGPVNDGSVNKPCQFSNGVVSSSGRTKSTPPTDPKSCITKASPTGAAIPTAMLRDTTENSIARHVKAITGAPTAAQPSTTSRAASCGLIHYPVRPTSGLLPTISTAATMTLGASTT